MRFVVTKPQAMVLLVRYNCPRLKTPVSSYSEKHFVAEEFDTTLLVIIRLLISCWAELHPHILVDRQLLRTVLNVRYLN